MNPLSKPEHLQKATHNESYFDASFGPTLQNNSTFLDWATTVIFYSALHYVDALLCDHGIEPNNHDDRRKHISIHPWIKGIQKEYKWLYDRSRDARYQNLSTDINPPRVLIWRNDVLETIKRHVQQNLSSS